MKNSDYKLAVKILKTETPVQVPAPPPPPPTIDK